MKIVERSVELINPIDYIKVLDNFNIAARNCYQSLNYANDNAVSAENLARRLIKVGHGSPIEMNNITVRIVGDRSFMSQLTRHRLLSFAIESARYCNYNSEKFDHDVKFIKPQELSEDNFAIWEQLCKQAELAYFKLIDLGAKPEVARSVLPMSLATTMIVSGNIREWRHVLELRCDSHAQSDIRGTMKELLKLLYQQYSVFFEDLYIKFFSEGSN